MRWLCLLILFLPACGGDEDFIGVDMATFAEQVEFLNVPQFDPTTNLRYSSGYVKVLQAGTSTLATVYSARDKGGTYTNPFALDADDTKEIYLDTGVYDFELYEGDPDDVDNPGVKRDTISGMTFGVSDNDIDDLFDGGYDKTIKVEDFIVKDGVWIDVRAHGTPVGGVYSETALQAAFDAISTRGTVVIPDGVTVDLTDQVTVESKEVTLLINGKLRDKLTAFTSDYTDLTVNNKGTVAFSGGSVSIIGGNYSNLVGGSGVGGVDQTERPFFYLYNTTGGLISGLYGSGFIGSAVATYECDKMTHVDSYYNGGDFTVLHSRGDDLTIRNVKVENGGFNGIIATNRGGFATGVLAFARPQRVKILDSYVYNTTSTNSYAVGLTADSCDGVIASGNDVDGNSVGTMAYSWADSTNVRVHGNSAANMDNVANGSYTYAGIGMEVDGVTNGAFFNNTFNECITGYLILDVDNVTCDGDYTNTAAKSAQKSTGAVAVASLAYLANVSDQSRNIKISGVVNGGNRAVSGYILADKVHIGPIQAYDVFNQGVITIGDGTNSHKIETLTIDNVSYSDPGNARRLISFSGSAPVKNLLASNLYTQATSAGTNDGIFLFADATGLTSKYTFRNVIADGVDEGFTTGAFNTGNITLDVDGVQFVGVTEADAWKVTEGTAKASMTNAYVDGVRIADKGTAAPIRYGTAAPTANADFVGQQFIDTTNDDAYVAIQTGTGATDWKKTTP